MPEEFAAMQKRRNTWRQGEIGRRLLWLRWRKEKPLFHVSACSDVATIPSLPAPRVLFFNAFFIPTYRLAYSSPLVAHRFLSSTCSFDIFISQEPRGSSSGLLNQSCPHFPPSCSRTRRHFRRPRSPSPSRRPLQRYLPRSNCSHRSFKDRSFSALSQSRPLERLPLPIGVEAMVVDCRGLIEFCKAFEHHRTMSSTSPDPPSCILQSTAYSRSKKQAPAPQTSSPPLCDQSSAAAVDVIILLLVLGSCGFLFTPYFRYFCLEAAEILPVTFLLIGQVVCQAPVAYISGVFLMFALVFGGWELYQYKTRKCDNPQCKGLRKAMEFDIQLESEQCVKSTASASRELPWKGAVELGEDHKELEAELRRMAPPNGRAVLVFRARCGCPAARMEVWGSKKPRKSKK